MTLDPCKNEALFSALMDNELPPEKAAALRRHMVSCAPCRQRFEALLQTDAMIRDMAPLEPSADFDRTFWQKVDERQEHGFSGILRRFRLIGWKPAVASGLAATAAAALIFVYAGKERAPNPEEMFIARNMELLENYDVIDLLDMLETLNADGALKEPS